MTASTSPAPPWRGPAPRRSDAVAALCCLVIAAGTLLAIPLLERAEGEPMGAPPAGSAAWWAVLLTLLAQAAALVLLRPLPRLAAVVVCALPLLLAVLAPGTAFGTTTVAVLWAAYVAGVRLRREHLAPVAGAMLALTVLATTVNTLGSEDAGTIQALLAGIGQGVIVIGVPLLLALIVVSRRQARTAHERELTALRREQDAQVAVAIAAERTAVARDLHDIAAHHMSGIAMLASALERQVDPAPEAAKESARDIRMQSTAVLRDLRRLVGLLRDEHAAPLADRSLASLAQLVDERRAAGAEIGLTVKPQGADPGSDVGALAQLVGYRMVQESLANAAVHAPAAGCEVRVDARSAQRVRIVVVNGRPARPGPQSGRTGGFGLIGMRERAELVGARLEYGPTGAGGWSVTLDLPRDGIVPDQPQQREEPT
ncbi:sensor histidine kinase [Brachybacterium sp. NPDC056505]|uniref:sensor histidine kinase n=1 Tax=Brachybacterium sp. NPDC056505 TaxID=3345843 RepID=UPI00366CD071